MNKKSKIPFLVFYGLFNITWGLVHPVTPTMIIERGLSSEMFGYGSSIYSLGMFLFSPFFGKLCTYKPTKKILFAAGIAYSLSQLIFALAYTDGMLLLARLLAGIVSGACATCSINYIVNTTPDANERGKYLTLMITVDSVCNACGYFIGGMLGVIKTEIPMYLQVVVSAIAIICVYMVTEDDTPYKITPKNKLSLAEVNPFNSFISAVSILTPMLIVVFLSNLFYQISMTGFDNAFNFYIKDQLGLTSAYNGTFRAFTAISAIAINSSVGMYLVKKTDVNKTIFYVQMMFAVPMCMAVGFRKFVIPFVACEILLSAMNNLYRPIMQNLVSLQSKKENSNVLMGFNQSVQSMGSTIGSFVAGKTYTVTPMMPFFVSIGSIFAALVLGFAYHQKYLKDNA